MLRTARYQKLYDVIDEETELATTKSMHRKVNEMNTQKILNKFRLVN